MGRDWATLPPRDLAKALCRVDPYRDYIADGCFPLPDLIRAYRRGGGDAFGRLYDVSIRGLHVFVKVSAGVSHDPPLRFTLREILAELRAESLAERAPTHQLTLW